MRTPTPVGRHSIAHQTSLMGAGMSMTVLDPSAFHGYTDSLQRHIDGVRSEGTAKVGNETCDVILVSIMKGQRTWRLWLSRRDHLPRKLRQVVHVSYDIITEERWSDVKVNEKLPDDLFVWSPPEGWTRWFKPSLAARLLKPGVKAPDFELTLLDGKRKASLSDDRGKAVWLNIWRVGGPPGREEVVHLQKLHEKFEKVGLRVLGLHCADKREIARALLRKLGITYPVILDNSDVATDVAYRRYRTSGVPVSYIIDREGRVAAAWYGFDEKRRLEVLRKLGIGRP